MRTEVSPDSSGSTLAMSWLSDGMDQAGTITLTFEGSTVKYTMLFCVMGEDEFELPESVSEETEKIWTFTRDEGGLEISCNEELVLKLDFMTDCTDDEWDQSWGLEPANVQFDSSFDTASIEYRQVKSPFDDPETETGKLPKSSYKFFSRILLPVILE